MKSIHIILSTILLMWGCQGSGNKEKEDSEDGGEVTVYTHRHYESDQMLFDLFSEKTGIKVNVVNAAADELIQKMKMEGQHSPSDVLITVDAGRLHRAKELDLLQPFTSETLKSIIPNHLKDEDNYWYGLTKRGRVIVYAKDRVSPEDLSTYEDLANERWRKRLLIRSSGNIYNQSLLASIIAHNGEAAAKEWAVGVVKNMARNPKGGDRDQVKAVVAGEGDIAVVNTYYLGKMLHSADQEEVETAQKVGLFFPNQEDRGTHINVSGAGVAKHAPNKENAIRFIEFLASEEAQKIFAQENFEYPVNDKVQLAEQLQDWGSFKEDTLNLSQLGINNKKAVLIFDEAKWP